MRRSDSIDILMILLPIIYDIVGDILSPIALSLILLWMAIRWRVIRRETSVQDFRDTLIGQAFLYSLSTSIYMFLLLLTFLNCSGFESVSMVHLLASMGVFGIIPSVVRGDLAFTSALTTFVLYLWFRGRGESLKWDVAQVILINAYLLTGASVLAVLYLGVSLISSFREGNLKRASSVSSLSLLSAIILGLFMAWQLPFLSLDMSLASGPILYQIQEVACREGELINLSVSLTRELNGMYNWLVNQGNKLLSYVRADPCKFYSSPPRKISESVSLWANNTMRIIDQMEKDFRGLMEGSERRISPSLREFLDDIAWLNLEAARIVVKERRDVIKCIVSGDSVFLDRLSSVKGDLKPLMGKLQRVREIGSKKPISDSLKSLGVDLVGLSSLIEGKITSIGEEIEMHMEVCREVISLRNSCGG